MKPGLTEWLQLGFQGLVKLPRTALHLASAAAGVPAAGTHLSLLIDHKGTHAHLVGGVGRQRAGRGGQPAGEHDIIL